MRIVGIRVDLIIFLTAKKHSKLHLSVFDITLISSNLSFKKDFKTVQTILIAAQLDARLRNERY